MAEKLDVVDSDDSRTPTLFFFSERSCFVRRSASDARLAAGGQDVRHLLALGGPAGDGTGRSVFQVVGVGDDGEGTFPVLVDGFHDTPPKRIESRLDLSESGDSPVT
jgi:hypothetical protein